MSPEEHSGAAGWFKQMLALPNDSPKKTLFVAIALCLVCSVLVATAAVGLKPLQEANASLDRKRNLLIVAGLVEGGETSQEVEALFDESVETQVVDLAAGEFADDIDAATFDQRKAVQNPAMSEPLPPEEDIASIKRRSKYANVYFIKDGETIKQVIFPIHGYGLWSTLYGFIALEDDLNTVAGLRFYEHGETAGLGAEVDNPRWLEKWPGRVAFDDSGDPIISVAKGTADNPEYEVDGLAGATLTGRGVTNMLHYWLGEQGFKPFLTNLRSEKGLSSNEGKAKHG